MRRMVLGIALALPLLGAAAAGKTSLAGAAATDCWLLDPARLQRAQARGQCQDAFAADAPSHALAVPTPRPKKKKRHRHRTHHATPAPPSHTRAAPAPADPFSWLADLFAHPRPAPRPPRPVSRYGITDHETYGSPGGVPSGR